MSLRLTREWRDKIVGTLRQARLDCRKIYGRRSQEAYNCEILILWLMALRFRRTGEVKADRYKSHFHRSAYPERYER